MELVRGKLGSAPAISASEVAQTNVIALTAISASPGQAALIANTYARAFVEQTQKTAIKNLTTAQATLHQQINRWASRSGRCRAGRAAATQVSALVNQQAVLKEEVAQLQVNGAAATSGVEFVTPAQRSQHRRVRRSRSRTPCWGWPPGCCWAWGPPSCGKASTTRSV